MDIDLNAWNGRLFDRFYTLFNILSFSAWLLFFLDSYFTSWFLDRFLCGDFIVCCYDDLLWTFNSFAILAKFIRFFQGLALVAASWFSESWTVCFSNFFFNRSLRWVLAWFLFILIGDIFTDLCFDWFLRVNVSVFLRDNLALNNLYWWWWIYFIIGILSFLFSWNRIFIDIKSLLLWFSWFIRFISFIFSLSSFLLHCCNFIQAFLWTINLLNLMLNDNLLTWHLTACIASSYRFLGIFNIFFGSNLRFSLRGSDLAIGKEYWLFVWRRWLDFSTWTYITNMRIVKLRMIGVGVCEILFKIRIFGRIVADEGNVYVSVFYFNWLDLRSCSI